MPEPATWQTLILPVAGLSMKVTMVWVEMLPGTIVTHTVRVETFVDTSRLLGEVNADTKVNPGREAWVTFRQPEGTCTAGPHAPAGTVWVWPAKVKVKLPVTPLSVLWHTSTH